MRTNPRCPAAPGTHRGASIGIALAERVGLLGEGEAERSAPRLAEEPSSQP
jgi:hypothetical protein